MLPPKQRCDFRLVILCFFFSLLTPLLSEAQPLNGYLTGRIIDGSSFQPLYGVHIFKDISGKKTTSSADGQYKLILTEGLHTIHFEVKGFQTKIIRTISIRNKTILYLDIILQPLTSTANLPASPKNDSIPLSDSIVTSSHGQEVKLDIYDQAAHSDAKDDLLAAKNIDEGTDQNAFQVTKRMSGIIALESMKTSGIQSIIISGMGERYNQLRINNLPVYSHDVTSRAYPLSLIPAQALQQISVQSIANASAPGDASGGSLDIQFKDIPSYDFLYLQIGATANSEARGKTFYGEKKGAFEALGFPGKSRDLPIQFPTSRSPSSFTQKNIQEQVYLSRMLNNNLGPVNYGSAAPGDKAILGFGKLIRLKKENKIGISAFLQHQSSEQIRSASVQVSPDLVNNPYPFNNPGKPLIRFQSNDTRYYRSTDLSGIFNTVFVYGKNKISFNTFLSNQLSSAYVSRNNVFKPEEDSAAHSGVYYSAFQRSSVSAQLSGEHALGEKSQLRFTWQFQYAYAYQRNPDERNFLLRQDSSDKNLFEIAHSVYKPFVQNINNVEATDPNLIKTSRKWKELSDQHFSGAFNISAPYNLFRRPNVISGGLFIQSISRNLHSDILFVQGSGFSTIEQLLSPDRYYPGGLSVTSTRVNNPGSRNVYANQLGNYIGSSNIGSAYIRSENRITNHLFTDIGIRMESSNQLVSNSQYNYVAGLRNPQIIALDENIYNVRFDFLPSVNVRYNFSKQWLAHAAWFISVNRPQMQELTKYRDFDALSSLVTTGNPVLRASSITNYDAGLRWREINSHIDINLSGFYKRIIDPIENVLSYYTSGSLLKTPGNTPSATVSGIKGSFKIDIGNYISTPKLFRLTAFVNGALIHSNVKNGPVKSNITPFTYEHSLSGSPEYTLNAGFMIYPSRFTQLSIWYNRTSDYITAVGSGKQYTLTPGGNTYSAIPDYRVRGRQVIDLQLSQKLFKERLAITGGAENLLGENYTEYQDLNGNKRFDEALKLNSSGAAGGFYSSGTDNTILNMKIHPSYYLTLSYIFK